MPGQSSVDARSCDPSNHRLVSASVSTAGDFALGNTERLLQPGQSVSSLPRCPSLSSLSNFADTLGASGPLSSPEHSSEQTTSQPSAEHSISTSQNLSFVGAASPVQPASSQPFLAQDYGPPRPPLPAKNLALATGSSLTR